MNGKSYRKFSRCTGPTSLQRNGIDRVIQAGHSQDGNAVLTSVLFVCLDENERPYLKT